MNHNTAYLLTAAAPGAAMYVMQRRIDLTTAGIAGAGALAGSLSAMPLGKLLGWVEGDTTMQNGLAAVSAGAGAGVALYFVSGQTLEAVAPIAGATAIVAYGLHFVSNFTKIN